MAGYGHKQNVTFSENTSSNVMNSAVEDKLHSLYPHKRFSVSEMQEVAF